MNFLVQLVSLHFSHPSNCNLNDKELQTVVSKHVFQFMNNKQPKVSRPVKVKFKPITSADTVVIYRAHYAVNVKHG